MSELGHSLNYDGPNKWNVPDLPIAANSSANKTKACKVEKNWSQSDKRQIGWVHSITI